MKMFLQMLQGSLKQPRLPHATTLPSLKKKSGFIQTQALLRLPGTTGLSPGSTEAGWGLEWKNVAEFIPSPGTPVVGLTFQSVLLFSFSNICHFYFYE